jgi:hypothetical protein
MSIRKWKIAALLGTSAVLLQAGGCATLIFQLFAQQIITDALNSLLSGIGGSDAPAEGTP